MNRSAVLAEALSSFELTGDSVDDSAIPSPRTPIPARRRSADSAKTGRARFAGNLCQEHPHWYADDSDTPIVAIPGELPCAKFSPLPGKGKGPKQPSAARILLSGFSDIIRPLVLIGLFIGAIYGFQHVILGGGTHLLRPKHSVQQTTGRVSDSSQHPTPSAVPAHSSSNRRRTTSGPTHIRTHSAVK